MVHKNNTWKYSVDSTCQNVSYFLLQLKSWLEKDAISAGPISPPSITHLQLKYRQRTKTNKAMVSAPALSPYPQRTKTNKAMVSASATPSPPPSPLLHHRFFAQSCSKYQNWKANKYYILTITGLAPPVLESSTRISNFMPNNSELKFINWKSKIGYP